MGTTLKVYGQLTLNISGQVFVSNTLAAPQSVLDAIAASTGEAFFINTADPDVLGGVGDGDAITSITPSDTVSSVSVVNATWNEAESAISLTEGYIDFALTNNIASSADVFFVANSTDTAWIIAGSTGVGTHYLGAMENNGAGTSVGAGSPTFFAGDTGPLTNTRQGLLTAYSVGSNVVVNVRGANLSANQWKSLRLFGFGASAAYNTTALIKGVLVCDALSNEDRAQVIADLASWPA